MKKFEQELATLKERLMEMGALAESMIAAASDALLSRDLTILAKVRATEEQVDRLQIEIDSEAIRLITIYTPTAKDLRFLLMVVRINTELERIGDQAVNNCEYVEMFLSAPSPQPLGDISRMTDITCGMLHDALQAFDKEDIPKARFVLQLDDAVDALNAQTFRDLLTDRRNDADLVTRSMSLILLARSIERVADHATNICEEVIYMVEGEDVRHQA